MGNCFTARKPRRRAKATWWHFPRSPSIPKKPNLVALESNNAGDPPSIPKKTEAFWQTAVNNNVHIFTYSEMRLTTNNFRTDQILGEGGFGIVYKGVIDENIRAGFPTTQVAVKQLNPEGFQGDREWLTEVNYLGQLSHPNLVKLIGCCCEDEHRLLVYEYMACGSLEKHLFRRVSVTMPWSTRMKIALGAAKGLAFLHGAERPIIYRDFKTSNILLDSDYTAKLSDFGLAKEGPMGDQTHVSTRVMGTFGYAAPEYVMTGHLTSRSDVYGFGVVLMEMLIGRKAMDQRRPSREKNLVEWARPLLNRNSKLLRILDPRMEGQYSDTTAQKVANLAYQCLSLNPKGRPTMSEVVEILETLLAQSSKDQDDPTLSRAVSGSVTLYEVRKDPTDGSEVKRGPYKSEDEIGDIDCGPRQKDGNGWSKSELPAEADLYSPTLELDLPQRQKKSSLVRNGQKTASVDSDLNYRHTTTVLDMVAVEPVGQP